LKVVDGLPGTDHSAVHFTFSIETVQLRSADRLLYNYKRADFSYFESVLDRVPWNIIDFDNDEVETSWTMWKDLFFSVIDLTIPKSKWKQRKIKHWFSSDTISLIHQKRKVYHAMKHCQITAKYKHLSNVVRFRTRYETQQLAASFSNSYSTNPKQLWRWINSVKGYRRPLPPLQEDTLIVDDYAKATAFNQYFQSVFTVEKLSGLSSLQTSTATQPSVIDCVHFTPDDVFQELTALDVSKACGPDLIPPLLLKKAASYICVPLSKLFTQSMSTGKLPLQTLSLFSKKVIHVSQVTTGLLVLHPLLSR